MAIGRFLKLCIIGEMFFFLSSCNDGRNETLMSEKRSSILWNVTAVHVGQVGRSLVANTDNLVSACTPTIGGESIAIWGDCVLNGQLRQEFKGTLLTYEEDIESGNYYWGYVNEPLRYWWTNVIYDFRAFFPANALGSYALATDASSLSISYDTETFQEDLMVAYTQVDTNILANTEVPVPLQMIHALATLKFVFKMEESSLVTNTLISASLGNTLKTNATLEYNTSDVTTANWTSLTASGNSQLYLWENGGIDFTASTPATAYTTPAGTTTTTGTKYCDCDGHVLIIPQTCDPVLNFATAYRSYNVSLGETEFEPGKQYVYNITLKENTQLNVTLTIKNWNELGSSYDINF